MKKILPILTLVVTCFSTSALATPFEIGMYVETTLSGSGSGVLTDWDVGLYDPETGLVDIDFIYEGDVLQYGLGSNISLFGTAVIDLQNKTGTYSLNACTEHEGFGGACSFQPVGFDLAYDSIGDLEHVETWGGADRFTAEFNYAGINYSQVWYIASLEFEPPTPVPVPAAAWLFGSALLGLLGLKSRKS